MAKTKRITLNVPDVLVKDVRRRLEADDSSLEEYLRLQLVTLSLARYVVGLDDEMPFGKYRGEYVRDVVRANPQYIAWLAKVSDIIKFTSAVLSALEQAAVDAIADRPKPTKSSAVAAKAREPV